MAEAMDVVHRRRTDAPARRSRALLACAQPPAARRPAPGQGRHLPSLRHRIAERRHAPGSLAHRHARAGHAAPIRRGCSATSCTAASNRRNGARDGKTFRAEHPQLRIGVLAGNHDRALVRANLEIDLLGDAVDDGAFSLRHAPDARAPAHVLCGHLHPTVRVEGFPGRWPAFWLQARACVLPAFSAFTGGRNPETRAGDGLVACMHGDLLRLA